MLLMLEIIAASLSEVSSKTIMHAHLYASSHHPKNRLSFIYLLCYHYMAGEDKTVFNRSLNHTGGINKDN